VLVSGTRHQISGDLYLVAYTEDFVVLLGRQLQDFRDLQTLHQESLLGAHEFYLDDRVLLHALDLSVLELVELLAVVQKHVLAHDEVVLVAGQRAHDGTLASVLTRATFDEADVAIFEQHEFVVG
jgi:hypothetical protein